MARRGTIERAIGPCGLTRQPQPPADDRTWIFLGSGIDMSYRQRAGAMPSASHLNRRKYGLGE